MSMEIIKKSIKTADIRLSIDEINTLRNALNEVCNALYVSEFKTRMGVSREEAIALADSILRLSEKLSLNNNTDNHTPDNSR